ncbi:unnamed protein product, partial [Phaeothamnion confervicola]
GYLLRALFPFCSYLALNCCLLRIFGCPFCCSLLLQCIWIAFLFNSMAEETACKLSVSLVCSVQRCADVVCSFSAAGCIHRDGVANDDTLSFTSPLRRSIGLLT